jgi:hypothetical protein
MQWNTDTEAFSDSTSRQPSRSVYQFPYRGILCPDWGLPWFYSGFPGEIRHMNLKLATAVFLSAHHPVSRHITKHLKHGFPVTQTGCPTSGSLRNGASCHYHIHLCPFLNSLSAGPRTVRWRHTSGLLGPLVLSLFNENSDMRTLSSWSSKWTISKSDLAL